MFAASPSDAACANRRPVRLDVIERYVTLLLSVPDMTTRPLRRAKERRPSP